jgi:phosphoglycerate kinase
MSRFRTLNNADLRGKRVLVRADLNVPVEDGKVTDLTRLERTASTILEIADKGGKVIVLSHFGRPKERNTANSLKPVAAALAKVVGRPVAFADDCIGTVAEAAVSAMKDGEVLCLENTRFHRGEEKNDAGFVDALAALGDIWVNDAFSVSHRAHASSEGLGHKLPAYAGRGMEAELQAITAALEAPQRPVAAIVGGAKVSTKLDLLGNLLAKVETLIIGGGMANTFLAAQGRPVGKSLCEHDLAQTVLDILRKAKIENREIVLPVDVVAAKEFKAYAQSRVAPVSAVADDEMILDIGPLTVEHIVSVLARVKTLVWNGPLGAFEMAPFDTGTVAVAEAAAKLTRAGNLVSIAGGGDTVAALNAANAAAGFTYVSTAGGAFLEWVEGKALPGVEILRDR